MTIQKIRDAMHDAVRSLLFAEEMLMDAQAKLIKAKSDDADASHAQASGMIAETAEQCSEALALLNQLKPWPSRDEFRKFLIDNAEADENAQEFGLLCHQYLTAHAMPEEKK